MTESDHDGAASNRGVIPTRRVSPSVVVVGVIALVVLALAALIVTEFAPAGKDTSIVVGFVTATVAPTIVGLLALLRADHVSQQTKANAHTLAETADRVEQVAANVNGHLARHDELAQSVTEVADTIAAATGLGVRTSRPATLRTRTTDTLADRAHDPVPSSDAPPLDPGQV